MAKHAFCTTLLAQTRREARVNKVNVPKYMTAIRSTRNLFFVEMQGRAGEYINGDCAYEAKARYIQFLIDTESQLETPVRERDN